MKINKKKGFTFIEVLISVLILTIGMGIMIGLFTNPLSSISEIDSAVRENQTVNHILQLATEKIRSKLYAGGESEISDGSEPAPPPYDKNYVIYKKVVNSLPFAPYFYKTLTLSVGKNPAISCGGVGVDDCGDYPPQDMFDASTFSCIFNSATIGWTRIAGVVQADIDCTGGELKITRSAATSPLKVLNNCSRKTGQTDYTVYVKVKPNALTTADYIDIMVRADANLDYGYALRLRPLDTTTTPPTWYAKWYKYTGGVSGELVPESPARIIKWTNNIQKLIKYLSIKILIYYEIK